MLKKFFIILSLLLLNNCATSGTALLGPIFTGAKTGSIYQASISYGSNKIINQLKDSEIITSFNNKNNQSVSKLRNNDLINIPYTTDDPIILLSYKVDQINFSEISEIEHLP
tara:strand:- start:2907 stop:3242 length:336 start_codon:yes stop_codon:yes gene_type:complete